MRNDQNTRMSLVCAAMLWTAACSSGAGETTGNGAVVTEDLRPLLTSAVERVILPTYVELHTRVEELTTCITELQVHTNDEQLKTCQQKWVAARVPWERSEGFLFGPVSNLGLDPAMDSWPVDHVQLDALMNSDVQITADTIKANLGGGLKGFHTIEYLLWGSNHDRVAADLANSPRRMNYLLALSQALGADTQTLVDAWAGPQGYGARFIAAGTEGATYSRQSDAVLELGAALSAICDEVGNGKIAEPFKANDPTLVESQYSYNSIPDFADNLRSVRNIYLGSLDGTVQEGSFSAVAARYAPDTDALVRQRITTAIESIEAISADGEPFRNAISNPIKAPAILAAQDALRLLYEALKGQLEPMFAR